MTIFGSKLDFESKTTRARPFEILQGFKMPQLSLDAIWRRIGESRVGGQTFPEFFATGLIGVSIFPCAFSERFPAGCALTLAKQRKAKESLAGELVEM